MTPEGKVKQQLKHLLSNHGRRVWCFWPIPLVDAGIPDVVGIAYGQFVAIEVKAPGKKPNPLQQIVHELIRYAGGSVFVYDGTSNELEAVLTIWSER